MVTLTEKTVSLPIEQAYSKLKETLLANNCKIIEEKTPQYIHVKQGSLSGILPKSAKKTVKFHLSPEDTATRIVSSTKIASDWRNLTLHGSVFAVVLASVFLWIAQDIQSYLENAKAGYWSWLMPFFVDTGSAQLMGNLMRALAVFLAAAILVEAVIMIYVYRQKNQFLQSILSQLENQAITISKYSSACAVTNT